MKNKKACAMNALKEIREMFKASDITENELQDSGRKIRRELMNRYFVNSQQNTPSSTLLPSREKKGL